MKERYENFTTLISEIYSSIRKIKTERMAKYEFSSIHITCLYYLYSDNTLTSKTLLEKCKEDKGAISRALKQLRKTGFVESEENEKITYKNPIKLTEKGLKAGKEIVTKVNEVLEITDRLMTDEERCVFYKCLSLVSNKLSEISGKDN